MAPGHSAQGQGRTTSGPCVSTHAPHSTLSGQSALGIGQAPTTRSTPNFCQRLAAVGHPSELVFFL